jgi:hypothetical protein
VDEFNAAGRKPDWPHLNSAKQFMKTSFLIAAASVALASLAPAAQTELKDQKDKHYSIGLTSAPPETPVNRRQRRAPEQGHSGRLSGNKALLTDEQVKETMAAFQKT